MVCDNWQSAKENMLKWWKGEPIGRPLMRIVAQRKQPTGPSMDVPQPKSLEERYLSPEWQDTCIRNQMRNNRYMADAFPSIDLNMGAGSLAVYLGCKPIFRPDTIWFEECVRSPDAFDLRYDPQNPWLQRHLAAIEQAQALSKGDYLVSIPDLIENIDILSAMRGPQNLCYDLLDEPEMIHRALRQLEDLYFVYYDQFYNLVKDKDNSASFTAFAIWAPGRVAKVQCDFSAMMSPGMYREFVLPSLQKQCAKLDYSLYHLDGPGALQHVDALMEIQELNALQWTPGTGNPDAADEKWYPLFDKVRSAGKSLWLYNNDGEYGDWIKRADRLVHTFGSRGIYLLFPDMSEDQAERLIAHAEDRWN